MTLVGKILVIVIMFFSVVFLGVSRPSSSRRPPTGKTSQRQPEVKKVTKISHAKNQPTIKPSVLEG